MERVSDERLRTLGIRTAISSHPDNRDINTALEELLAARETIKRLSAPVSPRDWQIADGSLPVHDELVKQYAAGSVPVDRSARVLTTGVPVPEDNSHTEIRGDGQQREYVVLTSQERSKGFVRPYRDAYRHLTCDKITTMGRSIAETYARDPKFYTGTFCTTCRAHFPVGENGEFVWYEMDGSTGPKVGV